MMGKLRENKGFYVLLSIILAFCFWMYVRTVEDPVRPETFHNVRVELTGTGVLTSQGLTVAELSHETVDLEIEAPNSLLNNLARYRGDLTVIADVSRCAEGANRVTIRPSYPTNLNVEDIAWVDPDPNSITVTVEKLYTKTLAVEFRLDGQVAEGYQMGTPAIEPTTVTVSGPVEDVSMVDKVVAILHNENLDERYAGDLPLTMLDSAGNVLDIQELSLDAKTAYVMVPVVVVRQVPLTVHVQPGGGASLADAKVDIEPKSIDISGEEGDLKALTELSIGSIDLAKVVGKNTFTFPISLDPSLENVSGVTSATVTVTVEGLSTISLEVDNIKVDNVPAGRTAVPVTQVKQVTIRGKEEDLVGIDPSQLRIVADLTGVTTTGQISVPAKVYLDAGGTVGVIGEYTIVVNVSR